MPHVIGHFCVCHVELWLLFHDFFLVHQCTVYLGTWVPGYYPTWVIPKTNTQKVYDNKNFTIIPKKFTIIPSGYYRKWVLVTWVL